MADSDSDTRSLSPQYKGTVYEHDRTYQKHSFEKHVYCVPIDEDEEKRLEVQHELINRVFGHRLFLSDIEDPRNVLDCGYGQAQWAIAVAQQYEECKVFGIDIFPLELPDEPDNLSRFCDDLNQDLTETFEIDTFDVIQSRFVAPGIHKNRWRSYVAELTRLLKPGGMLQMIEYYYNIQSSGGALTSANALYEWGAKYREAMSRDRDPRIGSSDPRLGGTTRLRQLMEAAGLVEIQQRVEDLPIGDWPSDHRQKQIGVRNLSNIDEALDSFGMWPFIERLGMTLDQVRALNNRAREELRDPRVKAYIQLTAVWGKRASTG